MNPEELRAELQLILDGLTFDFETVYRLASAVALGGSGLVTIRITPVRNDAGEVIGVRAQTTERTFRP